MGERELWVKNNQLIKIQAIRLNKKYKYKTRHAFAWWAKLKLALLRVEGKTSLSFAHQPEACLVLLFIFFIWVISNIRASIINNIHF